MTTESGNPEVTSDVAAPSGNEGDVAPPPAATPPPDPVAEERAARKAELDKLAKAASAKHREKQAYKARSREYDQTDAAREKELAESRALVARAKSHPLDFVEEHGATADSLAERVIKRGSYEEKLDELNAKIAAFQAKDEEARKAAAVERWNATRASAEESFRNLVVGEEDKFPSLALLDRDELIEKAHKVASQAVAAAKKRGIQNYQVDPRELAAELERRESPKFARHQERLAKKGADISSKDAATSTKANEQGDGLRGAQAGTPRTLTNTLSSERGSTALPLDQLPEKEQNRLLAEQLRSGRLRG